MSQHRDSWPVWVRIGLTGLPSRRSASTFAIGAVGVLVACRAARTWWAPLESRVAELGVLVLFLAVVWSVFAARWVDKHGKW